MVLVVEVLCKVFMKVVKVLFVFVCVKCVVFVCFRIFFICVCMFFVFCFRVLSVVWNIGLLLVMVILFFGLG